MPFWTIFKPFWLLSLSVCWPKNFFYAHLQETPCKFIGVVLILSSPTPPLEVRLLAAVPVNCINAATFWLDGVLELVGVVLFEGDVKLVEGGVKWRFEWLVWLKITFWFPICTWFLFCTDIFWVCPEFWSRTEFCPKLEFCPKTEFCPTPEFCPKLEFCTTFRFLVVELLLLLLLLASIRIIFSLFCSYWNFGRFPRLKVWVIIIVISSMKSCGKLPKIISEIHDFKSSVKLDHPDRDSFSTAVIWSISLFTTELELASVPAAPPAPGPVLSVLLIRVLWLFLVDSGEFELLEIFFGGPSSFWCFCN